MAYSKSAAIVADLRSRIMGGEYRRGDKLPTENELSSRFGVSRQTVRKALGELGAEGLITSVQGSGSYVAYEVPVRSRTMQITIITSYISEYIFPAILRGINDRMSAAGYTVNVRATNNSIATERRILEDILEHPVDGIAMECTKSTMPNPNTSLYVRIADMGIPIVMFNNYYPGLELPGYPHVVTHRYGTSMHSDRPYALLNNIRHVVLDDYAGGYALTEMLTKQGHTRIGGIFKSDDMQGFVRYSGYVDSMLYNRAPFDDTDVVWYTTESAPIISGYLRERLTDFRLFRTLLTECTAIVCYNDLVAQQILTVLDNEKVDSPVRAVYSFDRHLPLHSSKGIETYSLGYPKSTIGGTIAGKLLDMIDGRETSNELLAWQK